MDYLSYIKSENAFDFDDNEISIKDVSVSKKTRCFYVNIVIKKALNLKAFDYFILKNKELFNNVGYSYELKIEYINNYLSDDEISQYYNNIVLNLSSNSPFFNSFKAFNYKIDKNIITIYVDDITKIYNDCSIRIEEEFKKLYLNYNICLEVDDSAKKIKEEALKKIETKEEEDRQKKLKDLEAQQRLADLEIKNTPKNYRTQVSNDVISIKEIPLNQEQMDRFLNEKGDLFLTVEGEIFDVSLDLKGRSYLLTLKITDYTDSILVKKWVNQGEEYNKALEYKKGIVVKVSGRIIMDTYLKSIVLDAKTIMPTGFKKRESRVDDAPVKRVELHAHTKFTNMDGLSSASDYIDTLNKWGHKAVGFTDRNGVYVVSEVSHNKKIGDLKPIFGVELDYLDDSKFHITYEDADFSLKDATYVVFDIETTGFSQTYDDIIEIGAHKVRNGIIIDIYECFVNPRRPIPAAITDLTSITDDMVSNSPYIEEALKGFLDFSSGCVLVAHNADFDIGMIKANMKKLGFEDRKIIGIDTLNLSRAMYASEMKLFNLKALCRHFHVVQEHHHRATDDTKVTAECFILMLKDIETRGITNYNELNSLMDENFYKGLIPSRINVLVKNQVGFKNMYKIVSDALTEHLAKDARALKSVLEKFREGILLTSSGVSGMFEVALNRSTDELEDLISYVDIVEVQPINSYKHLMAFLSDGHDSYDIITSTIKKIIDIAKKLGKIVVATSDCYYIDPSQKKFREILIGTNQVGGGIHELKKYQEKYNATPDAHLRTTNEMLKEFDFLDKDLAYEIVVTNTNLVADMTDPIRCFHKEMFVPADDEFADHPDPAFRHPSMIKGMENIVADNLLKNYGDKPHPFVKARVDRELKSIISSGYYSTYFMAHLMVKDSLDNGYLVGSRGSVGSSFVATMMDITEVNPLPPHYLCPNCKFTAIKFSPEDESNIASDEERKLQEVLREYQDGYDLPDMDCPCCGSRMHKDGHDIPFETFLGFNGDKVPDIDLNFSGEYQPKAHLFVRKLMGYDNSFRGGTVGTIADNTAYGIVKEFSNKKGLELRGPEIERISKNLIDIKRSTGQHPGGIVVVPKRIDIYDVTPIQYPANDSNNPWRTTHFDYHAFEDNLLKLDILGHDDPTLIKYFMDIVHEHQDEFPFSDPRKIPVDDKTVFSLFGSTKAIGVEPSDIDSEVASFAVPELGTNFVRQMLLDTKPQSFAGLVKISGLSHGTGVWLGNSKELVDKVNPSQFGIIPFDKIIGCRDDIMVDLIYFGLEPLKAFKIMEFVRKGKVKKDPEGWAPFKQAMIEKNVPEWYIWSCEQIEYMFPKAHAVAYVLMALRIAWFKVYKPAMFYSAYFSKRAKAWDADAFRGGSIQIKMKLRELNMVKDKKAKTDDLITSLGVALECVARGIKFLPIDIFKSDATTFTVEGNLVDGNLRLPFSAYDGLGPSVAEDIVAKRAEKPFTSKQDVLTRTKLNQTIFENFEKMGVFGNLPDDDPLEEVGLFAL